MSAAELDRTIALLRRLSPQRQRSVMDFIEFLAWKEGIDMGEAQSSARKPRTGRKDKDA